MAAKGVTKVFECADCPEVFTRSATLGGHVHAAHPEHRRRRDAIPDWMPRAGARPDRPSLKRATDSWPGRP